MGAELCGIQQGDIIAVWGCGPVAQFAIASAFLLGAERVIAIDRFPFRLRMARQHGAETINYEETEVLEALREMTGGRGPDACIDAVGMEAHSPGTSICLRPCQASDDAEDGPADRLEGGDHGLPQWRNGVGDRRVRRIHRQVSHGSL